MRFAHYDLGEQPAGATAVIRLRGTAPNVILLDADNFARYRAGAPFRYIGGHASRSPVELEVPRAGHWYVVVDLGGFRGRVRGKVSVLAPDGETVRGAEAERVEIPA